MTTADRDGSNGARASQRSPRPLRTHTRPLTKTPLCARAREARAWRPAGPLPYTLKDAAGEAAGDVECTGCHRRYWSGEGHALYALCAQCTAGAASIGPNLRAALEEAGPLPALPPGNGPMCPICGAPGELDRTNVPANDPASPVASLLRATCSACGWHFTPKTTPSEPRIAAACSSSQAGGCGCVPRPGTCAGCALTLLEGSGHTTEEALDLLGAAERARPVVLVLDTGEASQRRPVTS